MPRSKICLVSNNEVFAVFHLDSTNPEHEALYAGLLSNPKAMMVNFTNPAFIGWRYDGVNFIDSNGDIYYE